MLVRSGPSPAAVAREFEPSAATIWNRVRQADIDEGRRNDGTTTRDREELGRLNPSYSSRQPRSPRGS